MSADTSEIIFKSVYTDTVNFDNNYIPNDNGIVFTFDKKPLASNDFTYKPKVIGNNSKILSVDKELNTNNDTPQNKTEIRQKIQQIMLLIKSNSYEEGVQGITDHELININENFEKADFLDICNGLWGECYKSKNQSHHAQLLNVFVNISDVVDAESFLPYAISAIAHKDIRIKEAAIAMFERWDNPEHKSLLQNTSDSGIGWLDQYKNDVLETLGS